MIPEKKRCNEYTHNENGKLITVFFLQNKFRKSKIFFNQQPTQIVDVNCLISDKMGSDLFMATIRVTIARIRNNHSTIHDTEI